MCYDLYDCCYDKQRQKWEDETPKWLKWAAFIFWISFPFVISALCYYSGYPR